MTTLTKDQRDEFHRLCNQVAQWLARNCHPHVKAIITNANGELVEGITFTHYEFIPSANQEGESHDS